MSTVLKSSMLFCSLECTVIPSPHSPSPGPVRSHPELGGRPEHQASDDDDVLLATSDEETASSEGGTSPDKRSASAAASPSVPDGASGAEIGSHQLDDTDSLGHASEDMVLGDEEAEVIGKEDSPKITLRDGVESAGHSTVGDRSSMP